MALTRIQTAALQSSITGSNITDGSIAAADLASGSVTPAKLSTGGPNWDSSSNMGIGVTPSAWAFSSLSIGGQAASFAGDVNTVYTQANAYYNAGWKYVGTGYAGQYQIDRAVTALHKWYTAPSGTAGNAISFTQAMTLDASGNLGLGISSGGSTRLTVRATLGSLATFTQTSATGYGLTIIPGADTTYDAFTINNAANTLNQIRMFGNGDASFSGNLVVGAASTRGTYKLDIRSDTSIAIGSNATYFGTIGYSAGTGFLSLAAESGGGINFLSGATERMRINSSGNVGIGTNAPTSKLDVSGTFKVTDASGNGIVLYGAYGDSFGGNAAAVIFAGDPGAGGGWYFWKCVADYNGTPDTRAFIHSNGGLYNFSANNSNLSDLRVKRDIALAGSYLDKICAIPVKTFKYKSQTLPEDQEVTLGVIAQDVEAIAPELVNVTGFGDTPEDGIPLKAIYQTDLQYALMKCIQELKAENDLLKARLDAAGL